MYMMLLLMLAFGMVYLDASQRSERLYPYPERFREQIQFARDKQLKHTKCPDCKYRTGAYATALYAHWTEKHGNLLFFKCYDCDESFLSPRRRSNHYSKVHAQKAQEEKMLEKKYRELQPKIVNMPPEKCAVEYALPYYRLIVNKDPEDSKQTVSPTNDSLSLSSTSPADKLFEDLDTTIENDVWDLFF